MPENSWAIQARRWFLFATVAILFLTALTKIVSSTGSARVLDADDPLLKVANRKVYLGAGLVELAIVWQLFRNNSSLLKVLLVSWLATMFAIYRLGALVLGVKAPCSCLGNAYSWLGVQPQTMNSIASGFFIFLLVGGYVFTVLELLQRRRIRLATV